MAHDFVTGSGASSFFHSTLTDIRHLYTFIFPSARARESRYTECTNIRPALVTK